MKRSLRSLLPAALGLAAIGEAAVAQSSPPVLRVEVVKRFPHDPNAFTQGLLFEDGILYESTGPYDRNGPTGQSDVRRVELATGKVLSRQLLPRDLFAEGLASFGGRLHQLTWTSKVGFVYDKQLRLQRQFRYATEGWGLTHDGTNLILSDGSSTLFFHDPATFALKRRVQVRAAGQPVTMLNELEFIDGQVYANVWQTSRIARIDPKTGNVTAWIDVSNLTREVGATDPDNVPNGIAYDTKGKRLFLTGKRWPTLFEVRVED